MISILFHLFFYLTMVMLSPELTHFPCVHLSLPRLSFYFILRNLSIYLVPPPSWSCFPSSFSFTTPSLPLLTSLSLSLSNLIVTFFFSHSQFSLPHRVFVSLFFHCPALFLIFTVHKSLSYFVSTSSSFPFFSFLYFPYYYHSYYYHYRSPPPPFSYSFVYSSHVPLLQLPCVYLLCCCLKFFRIAVISSRTLLCCFSFSLSLARCQVLYRVVFYLFFSCFISHLVFRRCSCRYYAVGHLSLSLSLFLLYS